MAKQYGITARLTIGEEETDISGFTFDVPSGALGARLSVPLADFEAQPDTAQPVAFEVIISKGGASDSAVLMDDGRIVEDSSVVQAGGDQVSLQVVSKLAEKWRQTPRQPVTLYDPDLVDVVTDSARTRNDVVDSEGAAIETIFTPIADFDLQQLLNFVYLDKLGFAGVITNIDTYPLPRADFSLRSPWHNVAAGQVQLFEPQYSSDDAGQLFIVDAQATLPAGFPDTVRDCGPGRYAQLQRNQQRAPATNAVMLTYKDNVNTAGDIADRIDQEIQEVGTSGQEGWQRSLINRYVKEFHSDPNNPDRITREIVWKVETRTSAKADGIVREIAVETQTDTYDFDWQLKTGYTKTVQIYTKLPGLGALMRQAQVETNRILWTASTNNPSDLQKTWELTEVVGTILVEGEEGDPDNPQVKTSLYEANRTNNIPDDAEVELGKPITTIIERWREVGPDQIEVDYQKTDHLTGRPEQTKTVQHTGTVTARLRGQTTSVTMLLRDEVSEAEEGFLPPVELNAGDVPFEQALEIANRVLARHGQQPQRVNISFAGIDVALRRGSLRRVSDRAGTEYLVFITGYQITGRNLGRTDFSVEQTAEGIVLQVL